MNRHVDQKHNRLEEVWYQVPADYYQNGVKTNYLQKRWHDGKIKVVMALLNSSRVPATILDVGSASGWFLSELKKHFPESACTGVDIYEPAIAYAKKHYKDIEFRVGDAHKLPFRSATFDLVICTEVLEHVVEPESVVSELARVLKPGGRAVIEMDSGNFLFKMVWYWWTNIRKGVWRDSHIHVFDAEILERLLKKSSMEIIRRKNFNFTMGVAFLMGKSKNSL